MKKEKFTCTFCSIEQENSHSTNIKGWEDVCFTCWERPCYELLKEKLDFFMVADSDFSTMRKNNYTDLYGAFLDVEVDLEHGFCWFIKNHTENDKDFSDTALEIIRAKTVDFLKGSGCLFCLPIFGAEMNKNKNNLETLLNFCENFKFTKLAKLIKKALKEVEKLGDIEMDTDPDIIDLPYEKKLKKYEKYLNLAK